MTLISFGLNHHSAPLALREKLAFCPTRQPVALAELMQTRAANEALILSTCNRTEIYAEAMNIQEVVSWLAQWSAVSESTLLDHGYCYHEYDALHHMLRVACGVDSMALGEPQILGQLKQAYQLAQAHGGVGERFLQLFPSVFAMAKTIRHESELGKNPVSLAYTVVSLAERIFARLADCTVLFVGGGETIELVATHLQRHQVKRLLLATRSPEKAIDIEQRFGIQVIRISEIPTYLPQADVVISATASQLPLIGKGMVESMLKQRRARRSLLMVDLAVPRDIEPEVAALSDVYLYNMDDLQAVIAANMQSREQAAKQAESMIDLHIQHYLQNLRVRDAGDMIRAYREQAARVCVQETHKGLQLLESGRDAREVLNITARAITNKLIHRPTQGLRKAVSESDSVALTLMKEICDLV